jgi:rSAM/selenodomain-associated transferase 1
MTAIRLDSSSRVLGLFAKEPRPGQVKTRLAAQTSAEWAARVAEAFLLDTLERLAPIDAGRVLAFTPASAHGYFAEVCRDRFRITQQTDGDLGRRMAAFFTQQLQTGAAAVVLVGTDSPTLPVSFILQAFQELERSDVVIGPSTDGGYYLIGCARPLPSLFEGIRWSTSLVLADTIATFRARDWRLALLSPWYDVDTLDDWQILGGHVMAQRRAGMDPSLPYTEQLLQENIQ